MHQYYEPRAQIQQSSWGAAVVAASDVYGVAQSACKAVDDLGLVPATNGQTTEWLQ